MHTWRIVFMAMFLLLAAACTSNEAMIEAAARGETGTVLTQLADGADPAFRSRAPDRKGQTVLSAAAGAGHKGTVEALLRKGMDPREHPEAILAAASEGAKPIAALLLDHGADPNTMLPASAPGEEVRTALGAAARGGHGTLVKLLLDGGAQARAHESVALRQAVRAGDEALVRLLLRRGASATIAGPDGAQALHLAAARSPEERRGIHREALIRVLHKSGAKVDAADAAGDTPLMHAVRGEAFRHVELLLSLGASPDHPCAQDETPRQYATSHRERSPEMARIARTLARASDAGAAGK